MVWIYTNSCTYHWVLINWLPCFLSISDKFTWFLYTTYWAFHFRNLIFIIITIFLPFKTPLLYPVFTFIFPLVWILYYVSLYVRSFISMFIFITIPLSLFSPVFFFSNLVFSEFKILQIVVSQRVMLSWFFILLVCTF